MTQAVIEIKTHATRLCIHATILQLHHGYVTFNSPWELLRHLNMIC